MFGSEFTSLVTVVELVKALRIKLQKFGIPILGPANVYCDDKLVFKNVSKPKFVLQKIHHKIAYHFYWESMAAGII